jgi:PAS domain S-box-containing protein
LYRKNLIVAKKTGLIDVEQRLKELERTESDYRKARSALEETVTRYRTLFEAANDAIFLVKETAFVECNRKALEIFGCNTSEDMIGKTFYRFSPERQSDGMLSKDKGIQKRKLAAQGIPQFFEWTHTRLEGTLFESEVSLNRIELKGEVFVQGIVRDITKRKAAENDLRRALAEIERLKDQLEHDRDYLQEEIKLSHNFEEIIGQSEALKYVLFKVEQLAPAETTVLLLGETGVGKELFARAIHNASPHKARPLVKVDCASLPPNLIESELFGHEKGAFTGAHSRQVGRFELANGTTIFLDEVGELPMELQAKLLRVLQDGEFERLGSSRTTKVKVRIIAATNRDLKKEVQGGRFREDLWYRLNVFPLTIPPLRERKEDIPLLVNALVKRYASKMGKHFKAIPRDVVKTLERYHWPGNVRELENVIERGVIISPGPVLRLEVPESVPSFVDTGQPLEGMERSWIVQVLEKTNWTIEGSSGAAQALGLKPSTLRSRMKKLGIRRP